MDILSCGQEEKLFPELLKDINKSPEKLFYKGEIGVVNEMPCVAIIGSREASAKGLEMAFAFGRAAAESGFVVVNGLALGCDAQAFRGALSVGGRCAALLPGGLDEIYPKSNAGLAEEILEKGGCLISEYRNGVRPQKYSFVERDRLQSGISLGVVVIETADKGGTMHTVKFAERQGRRLACYYSRIIQMASGNQTIVNKGIGVPLENEKSLTDFLFEIRDVKVERYEQLTLF